MRPVDPHIKLSAYWLFILLNIIFRDLHQFAKKDFLEMLLTGYYNGVEVTDRLLLLGGFLSLVPISMVLFSLILDRRYLRPMTYVAGVVAALTMVSSPPGDLDDGLHFAVQVLALAAIFRTNWKWFPQNGEDANARVMVVDT